MKYYLCAVLPAEARFSRGAGGLAAGQAEAGVQDGQAGHLPHHLLHPATLGDRGGLEQGLLETQHRVRAEYSGLQIQQIPEYWSVIPIYRVIHMIVWTISPQEHTLPSCGSLKRYCQS